MSLLISQTLRQSNTIAFIRVVINSQGRHVSTRFRSFSDLCYDTDPRINFQNAMWDRSCLHLYLSLQRHCSPGWASASFKSFLRPSRFRATTVQFLHPSLAAPSFTPSSQRSLGLPLGRFLPGPLRRTLLDKSSSSWRMTCPAYLNLLSLQNFTVVAYITCVIKRR